MPDPARVAVFTIPSHYAFADALVAGLIEQFGRDPVRLAQGRILLPNNRAARALTDAFVRASGGGLLLPRMIPIGDPELEERVGGALDEINDVEPLPPAVEPSERLLRLATIVRAETPVESVRLASELARTLDALIVEQIDPSRLKDAVSGTSDLAHHWERSLERLQLIYRAWPELLAEAGAIDLADRRNRLFKRLTDRWRLLPPPGFTVAAGITTAAPAVATLLARIAQMRGGTVVLPGLWLSDTFPDDEWEALGDEGRRNNANHPQHHLKLLLDRMGLARGEVQAWRWPGGAASSTGRMHAVAKAMTAPHFTHKWQILNSSERELSGVRVAELPSAAAEAQAIALALREALETPGKTAALITPDRQLAARVSALLARWDIEADDSAGRPLSIAPAGTLLLSILSAAAEKLAPVALLALLKHPLAGGEGTDRLAWLEAVRELDLKLRGPRPAAGLAGLDMRFGNLPAWQKVRARVARVAAFLNDPMPLSSLASQLSAAAQEIGGDAPWRGPAGRMAADMLAELMTSKAAQQLTASAQDAVALLRLLMDGRAVRPAYGGHPRISIWGLLEARLQRADLIVLGGLNEETWPALPAPDPWLPPKVRASLGMPTSDTRIGLAAQDFASALGAPDVLITRARRDPRSPAVASRFLLRLNAISGQLPHDRRLEMLTRWLDNPGPPNPATRPAPAPPPDQRPRRISVTQVDRLKADPFAFYARAILKLAHLDLVDDDHTAAWKGMAVHEVLEHWLAEDHCAPETLRGRAERLLQGEAVHPMLRALWGPRLLEAIDWIASQERQNRARGRTPEAAEVEGEALVAGVTVHGRADRIDRLPGGSVAIIDYKTGAPPTQKAVDAGFALQLGLLGLITREGGMRSISGNPEAFEYWSLARHNGKFGRLMCPAGDQPDAFLDAAQANFTEAAGKWLTGSEPFTAKLNPAFAPFGDYDQLMRLEEWYGH